MNQQVWIEGTSEPLFIGDFFIASDSDQRRYLVAAKEYRTACATRPFLKRSVLAAAIGAKVFEVSLSELQTHERGARKRSIAEIRHKLMAFTRVVSLDTSVINSWNEIGRAFNRDHSTVIHAVHKYGEQVASALRA